MPLSEFDLIRRYFLHPAGARADVCLGIGDDGAILRVPVGMDLVVSMDTLVAGVHFLEDCPPEDVGHKALAVNLSDLAAMGACPAWATLALTLPVAEESWLEAFAEGFFRLAGRFSLQLVGGDITRGPLCVTLEVHGFIPQGSGLKRSGARLGDGIYVTGSLGDAALALAALRGEEQICETHRAYLLDRLRRPSPRIAQGIILREIASSAIDVSDGLTADLDHILEASGAGAVIETHRVPLSAALQTIADRKRAWDLALTGGDDYELCFTVPEIQRPTFESELAIFGCPVTRIGWIESAPGLRCVGSDGTRFEPPAAGYRHF